MRKLFKRRLKRVLNRIADAMGLQEIARTQQQIASDVKRLQKVCTALEYQAITVGPEGLPIPPPQLHFLVSGYSELGVSDFLEIGKACADSVSGLLKKHGLEMDGFQAILDFGCGCGRVIRHFHYLRNAKIFGTDYNPLLIDWCKGNLPFGEFTVNQLAAPLAYEDKKFDLIYAFSVFTHLTESLQFSWFAELTRILKPGGYLLITTHGGACARAVLPSDKLKSFNSGQLVVLREESAGKNECSAYHPPMFVKNNLATGFDVIDFVEAVDSEPGNIAPQDIYLLRKEQTANAPVP